MAGRRIPSGLGPTLRNAATVLVIVAVLFVREGDCFDSSTFDEDNKDKAAGFGLGAAHIAHSAQPRFGQESDFGTPEDEPRRFAASSPGPDPQARHRAKKGLRGNAGIGSFLNAPLIRDILDASFGEGAVTVVKRLGSGTFGSVYEVDAVEDKYDTETQRRVVDADGTPTHWKVKRAVKIVRETIHDSLEEECYNYRKLCNFHVVCSGDGEYRRVETRGETFGVCKMEVMTGGTLHKELTDGRSRTELLPPLADVKRMVEHVLLGLLSLNSQGYVHNDIKPNNIFLDKSYGTNRVKTYKIGDLGLIGHMEMRGKLGPVSFFKNSHHRYMHPDLKQAAQLSRELAAANNKEWKGVEMYGMGWPDLFALGIMTIEMLLGSEITELDHPEFRKIMDANMGDEARAIPQFYRAFVLDHPALAKRIKFIRDIADDDDDEQESVLNMLFEILRKEPPYEKWDRSLHAEYYLDKYFAGSPCRKPGTTLTDIDKYKLNDGVITKCDVRKGGCVGYSYVYPDTSERLPCMITDMCVKADGRGLVVSLNSWENPFKNAKYYGEVRISQKKMPANFIGHDEISSISLRESSTANEAFSDWSRSGFRKG